jgi:hypothetical protein
MRLSTLLTRRPWALSALALGGTIVMLLALPSRGQQPTPNQPTIQLTVPAVAEPGRTRVSYQLALPDGFELSSPPAVRVVHEDGKLAEFGLLQIEQQTPVWSGFRRLWTKTYTPGTYRVTIEVEFKRPDGTGDKLVTPAATLTVPEPVPAPAS